MKQQLLGYLHDKTMLIILDNFEHLLSGVDLLIDILEAAPQVLLLVTSRVRLNILPEYTCPVPGLDLPEEYPLAPIRSTDDLTKYGAVRFFVQCAQMTAPQFQIEVGKPGSCATYLPGSEWDTSGHFACHSLAVGPLPSGNLRRNRPEF